MVTRKIHMAGTPQHADYEKVSLSYRQDLEHKIFSLTATVDEVLDWYYSRDPVGEDFISDAIEDFTSRGRGSNKNILAEKMATDTLLVECAALILMADALELGKFEKSVLSLLPHNHLGSIDYAKQIFEQRHLLGSKFDIAFIAADCFQSASSSFAMLENTFGFPAKEAEGMEARKKLYAENAVNIYVKLSMLCNQQVAGGDLTNWRIGLTSNMHVASSLMVLANSQVSEQKDDDSRKLKSRQKAFNILLASAEKYFINPAPGVKVIKGERKGELYELVWLLDMSYILLQSKTQLSTATVTPASHWMDSPKIGRPQKNRGIDMLVELDPSHNEGFVPIYNVQLKASPRQSKAAQANRNIPHPTDTVPSEAHYHAGIIECYEPNFIDVDVRRLKSKIKAYRDWVNSGCGEENSQRVEHFILSGPKITLEKIEQDIAKDFAARALERTRYGLFSAYALAEVARDAKRSDRRRK